MAKIDRRKNRKRPDRRSFGVTKELYDRVMERASAEGVYGSVIVADAVEVYLGGSAISEQTRREAAADMHRDMYGIGAEDGEP